MSLNDVEMDHDTVEDEEERIGDFSTRLTEEPSKRYDQGNSPYTEQPVFVTAAFRDRASDLVNMEKLFISNIAMHEVTSSTVSVSTNA
ncbi:hypothetical protein NP233_g9387 [Leucocoprinus birnbaumii]|uniref:Uncharacterized protein n=1 Tax=Leucocoprinus birnbaumii TaxID=56174 RepID=A0AAD5VKH2_9AGAR|nr:hypothetical protein NP233_g9387 [Leucocoprinus birnbaumii]